MANDEKIKEIKEAANSVIDLICKYITNNADESRDYDRFLTDMKNDEKFQEIIKEMTEHM